MKEKGIVHAFAITMASQVSEEYVAIVMCKQWWQWTPPLTPLSLTQHIIHLLAYERVVSSLNQIARKVDRLWTKNSNIKYKKKKINVNKANV